MARGRIISKSLSTSKKWNGLPTDTHRMLYVMIIPHTDGKGRVDGSAFWIKHNILPALNIPEKRIGQIVNDLETANLVKTWKIGKGEVLEVQNFAQHQKGLKLYQLSDFPDFPGNSLIFPASRAPAEGEGEGEEKGREVKDIVPPLKNQEAGLKWDWRKEKFINKNPQSLKKYESRYEYMDINEELEKIADWAVQRQARAKEIKDWNKFFHRWFKKADEKAKQYGEGKKGEDPDWIKEIVKQ